MAMIGANSTCALCKGSLPKGKSIFATSGVFYVPDGLMRYCDAPMHWDCYAQWPHRKVFAEAYLQMWVEVEEENSFWSKVWLDDDMLVTVNPHEPIEEVCVRLAQTGSDISVSLADWSMWLAEQSACPQGKHLVEAAALAAVLPTLQAQLPTAQVILSRVDFAAKVELSKGQQQEYVNREAAQAAKLLAYNQRCAVRWQQASECPSCQGTELRFTDGKMERKSFYQCLVCGRTFGPDDLSSRSAVTQD